MRLITLLMLLLATLAPAAKPAGPLPEPFTVQIDCLQEQIQGHYITIPIRKLGESPAIAGFELLIQYDHRLLLFFQGCTPAELLQQHGWQHLECRFVDPNQTGVEKDNGFLFIQAVADDPDSAGAGSPIADESGELLELKFYLTNDRTYDCHFSPIRFVWSNEMDNRFWRSDGRTFIVGQEAQDFNWRELRDAGNEYFKIDTFGETDSVSAQPLSQQDNSALAVVVFQNGGAATYGGCTFDRRGDMNLNGIDDEREDVELYTSYFMEGLSVFDISVDGQTAASETNKDGLPLTVADLVYLMRRFALEELLFFDLHPFADTARAWFEDWGLHVGCPDSIAGVYVEFERTDSTEIAPITTLLDMQLDFKVTEDKVRVLLWPGLDNPHRSIPPGVQVLFRIQPGLEIQSVQLSDYDGNLILVREIE
ncbi:MAG: hypothetical protein ABIJ61_09000 [bacterium]